MSLYCREKNVSEYCRPIYAVAQRGLSAPEADYNFAGRPQKLWDACWCPLVTSIFVALFCRSPNCHPRRSAPPSTLSLATTRNTALFCCLSAVTVTG